MRSAIHTLSEERGAAAVEFALLLSVFIVLVMGVIEFGRGYNATIELTGAVREGSRVLALGQPASEAQEAVVAASPGLDPEPTFSGIAECPNAADQASITATYSMPYNIPFVAQGTWNISRAGVMRCGG
ncbi:MAG: pilus assembly protein [Actinobacteria bacterium]|nr:pilus assembly protein [Actinomycetota bacterium]